MVKMADATRDPILLGAGILWLCWLLTMVALARGVGAAPQPTIALDAIALPGASVTLHALFDPSDDGNQVQMSMVAPGFEPPGPVEVSNASARFSIAAPDSTAFFPWTARVTVQDPAATPAASDYQDSPGILQVITAEQQVIVVALDGTISLEPLDTISSEAPPRLRPGTIEGLRQLARSSTLVAITDLPIEHLPHLRRWWRSNGLPRVVFKIGGSEVLDALVGAVGKIDAAIVAGGQLETAARVRNIETQRIGGDSIRDWNLAAERLSPAEEKDKR